MRRRGFTLIELLRTERYSIASFAANDDRDVSAPHIDYANFVFGDGRVRSINENIDFSANTAMGTRAGNEVVNELE